MSEREFSPSEALSRIENIISSLSLTFTAQHADSSKLVATAELFDKNNNLVDSGAGKGPDSLIGALAESIEHLSASQHIPDNITVKHCTFIAKQKAAKHDGFLNNLSSRDDAIDTFKLTTLDNSKAIFVPSLLLCPGAVDAPSSNVVLSSQFLSRYSSNSGTAFGCTQPEALLHGIHEIIERHTLSCFFMAICAFGPTMKLYAPSKALLAASLKNNPSALALADKLQIIIIKDLMNVFFSVALPKKGPGHFHLSPIGSGCSLDICTAVQRAVTEQFQADTLYDDSQELLDRKTLDLLSTSKALTNLIDFKPVKNLSLPLLDLPSERITTSVPSQLKTLLHSTARSGKTIYHRTVIDYPDNGIVCQAYIPGLERFNIIRAGHLVAPQRILRQQQKTP